MSASTTSTAFTPWTPAFSRGVLATTLENGLRILVRRWEHAAVAGLAIHVNAGYFDEAPEAVGIAHVLEHLCLKGTPSYPSQERLDEAFRRLGAARNAATGYDCTVYTATVPAAHVPAAVDLLAECYTSPLVGADELARELEVIIEEVLRKLDSPAAVSFERFLGLMFPRHPIGRWRMGMPEQLRSYRRDDVLAFHRRFYRPERTVVSVVGPVDAAAITGCIAAAFSAFGADQARADGDEGSDPLPQELPAPTGLAVYQQHGPTRRPLVHVGYRAPGVATPDAAALDLLATMLGGGVSARLNQRLREDLRVVTGIGALQHAFRDAGLIYVQMSVDADKVEAAEDAYVAEIERFRLDGPAPEERERALARIETSFLSGLESALGLARSLAWFESYESYTGIDEYLEALRAVEEQELLEVGRRYLVLDGATVLEFLPEDAADGLVASGAPPASVTHLGDPPVRMPDREAALAAHAGRAAGAAPRRRTLPAPETPSIEESQSGVRVVLCHRPLIPLVTAGVLFLGGRARERPGCCGITRLMMSVQKKDTRRRSAAEMAAAIDGLGGRLAGITGADTYGWLWESAERHVPPGLDLVAEILSEPSFLAERVDAERNVLLAAIQAHEDDTAAATADLFRAALYGDHPYGLPVLGAAADLAALTSDRLRQWHRDGLQQDPAVAFLVGDLSRARTRLAIEQLTALVGAPRARWRVDEPTFPGAPLAVTRRRRKQQSGIMIGCPGLHATSPHRLALELLRAAVGGPGGRVSLELRGRRSLAYVVQTFASFPVASGAIGIFLACAAEKEDEAVSRARELLLSLPAQPLSTTEVDIARTYYLGARAAGLQSARSLAAELAGCALVEDSIESFLTQEQAMAALCPEHLQDAARVVIAPRSVVVARLTADDGAP
ncbi:MAG: insulinase family protein [Candidatus Schekmanbacteria bacterium]|nr:insulinase family protein [Candidatus Schekmanbacteria bacterium]